MDWLEALILGIIQGLTEFLPVSSSGHLELVKVIFGNGAKSIDESKSLNTYVVKNSVEKMVRPFSAWQVPYV